MYLFLLAFSIGFVEKKELERQLQEQKNIKNVARKLNLWFLVLGRVYEKKFLGFIIDLPRIYTGLRAVPKKPNSASPLQSNICLINQRVYIASLMPAFRTATQALPQIYTAMSVVRLLCLRNPSCDRQLISIDSIASPHQNFKNSVG